MAALSDNESENVPVAKMASSLVDLKADELVACLVYFSVEG